MREKGKENGKRLGDKRMQLGFYTRVKGLHGHFPARIVLVGASSYKD